MQRREKFVLMDWAWKQTRRDVTNQTIKDGTTFLSILKLLDEGKASKSNQNTSIQEQIKQIVTQLVPPLNQGIADDIQRLNLIERNEEKLLNILDHLMDYVKYRRKQMRDKEMNGQQNQPQNQTPFVNNATNFFQTPVNRQSITGSIQIGFQPIQPIQPFQPFGLQQSAFQPSAFQPSAFQQSGFQQPGFHQQGQSSFQTPINRQSNTRGSNQIGQQSELRQSRINQFNQSSFQTPVNRQSNTRGSNQIGQQSELRQSGINQFNQSSFQTPVNRQSNTRGSNLIGLQNGQQQSGQQQSGQQQQGQQQSRQQQSGTQQSGAQQSGFHQIKDYGSSSSIYESSQHRLHQLSQIDPQDYFILTQEERSQTSSKGSHRQQSNLPSPQQQQVIVENRIYSNQNIVDAEQEFKVQQQRPSSIKSKQSNFKIDEQQHEEEQFIQEKPQVKKQYQCLPFVQKQIEQMMDLQDLESKEREIMDLMTISYFRGESVHDLNYESEWRWNDYEDWDYNDDDYYYESEHEDKSEKEKKRLQEQCNWSFERRLIRQIQRWTLSEHVSWLSHLYRSIVLQFANENTVRLNNLILWFDRHQFENQVPRNVIDFKSAFKFQVENNLEQLKIRFRQLIPQKQWLIYQQKEQINNANHQNRIYDQNQIMNIQPIEINIQLQMMNSQNSQQYQQFPQQDYQNQMMIQQGNFQGVQDNQFAQINNQYNNNQLNSVHSSQNGTESSQRIINNFNVNMVLSSQQSIYTQQSSQRDIPHYMNASLQQSQSSQRDIPNYIVDPMNVNMVQSIYQSQSSQREHQNQMNMVHSPQQSMYPSQQQQNQGIIQYQHAQFSNQRLHTSVQGSQGGSRYFDQSFFQNQPFMNQSQFVQSSDSEQSSTKY